jgi:hypothetical protein
MDNLRNTLPVAVEQVGGGEARVRTGGLVIPLDGQVSGSFSTGTATKFRMFANLRTNPDLMVLISYSVPAALANAEYGIEDRTVVVESICESSTVYWRLINPGSATDQAGATDDYLCVTFYE